MNATNSKVLTQAKSTQGVSLVGQIDGSNRPRQKRRTRTFRNTFD